MPLPLVALSSCLAPSIGAECDHGASRSAGDHVESCDCPNLGGSGPFSMDVCTGTYQWLLRYEPCEADGKVCVETSTGADCAWPEGKPPPTHP